MPLTLPLPDAVRCLLDQVLTGGDAVLDGPSATVALDRAAALLAAQRCRVVRASAAGPGGLGLPGLMAQVAGGPAPAIEGGDSLEQGAQALTSLDDGCDRVVLLLDGAGDLPAVTLRYLQLTCRTSASLRLVLVGRPDALDGPEFGYLRARLSARPVLAPQAAGAAGGAGVPGLTVSPSERAVPSVVRAGRLRPAVAALGMAACLALGVLIGQQAPASSAAETPAASSPTSAATLAAAPAPAAGAVPPAAMAFNMLPPGAPVPDAAAPVAPAASPPALGALAATAPAPNAPPSTALTSDAPAPSVPAPTAPQSTAPASTAAAAPASPIVSPVVVDSAAAFPPPGAAMTMPPAMVPARAAPLAEDWLPVPPMPPLNRSGLFHRQGNSRRRDALMAGGRSASPPRPYAMRSFARGRSYGRAYDPWARSWDDPSGPEPGWQPSAWQGGDRGWLPPRAYPGDAYAGRDYP